MLEIAHPKLRQLYDYWCAKRGDRQMPARADLDPVDMGFVIGNMILVDVLDGTPPQFRIRLHGSNLSERVGFELTGKMLDDLPEPEFRDQAYLSFWAVVAVREPRAWVRDRVLDGRLRRYETVVLPLSNDGEQVDMLLVGLLHDDERR